MAENRRVEDKRWEEFQKAFTELQKEVNTFSSESRAYRASDAERQLNFLSDLSEIKTEVKKTNGRVTALEGKNTVAETKDQDKKESVASIALGVSIFTGLIVALSAVAQYFKK